MTEAWRLALGVSTAVHAVLLAGAPNLWVEPPAFAVEPGLTSLELQLAAPAPEDVTQAEPVETQPPAPPEPQPVSISSEAHQGADVHEQPGYLRNPPPIYPLRARELGQEGTVVLEFEVLPNGRCGAIDVIESSGYPLLDDSAVRAVKHWIFKPAKRFRHPVAFAVQVPITFRLTDAHGRLSD